MDRIDAMRAFVAAVDRGSLAAASRSVSMSPAAVTRAIAALEERLSMKLLHRTTRALHLTQFGETYLATCREVLAALDAVERGAAAEQERPSGLLTITAPLRFGQLHLRPVLDEFLAENPAVRARLLLLDRMVNLVEEGIDLALRIGHLPDSSLTVTKLGEVRRVLCAAPAYIERCGTPAAPAALQEHACIMEHAGAEAHAWRFVPAPGRPPAPVAVQPRLIVNSASAAIDSVIAGYGITCVMSYQVAQDVAAGRLVVLLPQHEIPPLPVQLVTPPRGAATAKQRAFVAFMVPRLRQALLRSAAQLQEQPAGTA
ncbi:MAG: LysR family transcriptional regulator [Proteobacteria bacterium]|nr:LysR family transcriptional regulator [Pseudomonadota bacterium]MBU6425765.1 LysR family transcriptional regulator [Rhodospirillales bacterium]